MNFKQRFPLLRKGRKTAIYKTMPALILIALAFLGMSACSKQEETVEIKLPPTPILTIQAQWGVVKAPYLRVREEPNIKSSVVEHLRIGSITEILSKTEHIEVIEEENNYWYEIYSNGVRGWVFGAYLDFFDSEEKAVLSAQRFK